MKIFPVFYAIVRQIPPGKVATYGQVARLAGMPRCARTVGYAMAACRDAAVSCHRVVDRFGGTKACFDTYAPGIQRALLEAEGVTFTPEGDCGPYPLPVAAGFLKRTGKNVSGKSCLRSTGWMAVFPRRGRDPFWKSMH